MSSRNDKSKEMLQCNRMTKMDSIMGTRFALDRMQVDPARPCEKVRDERYVPLPKTVLMDWDYDK